MASACPVDLHALKLPDEIRTIYALRDFVGSDGCFVDRVQNAPGQDESLPCDEVHFCRADKVVRCGIPIKMSECMPSSE